MQTITDDLIKGKKVLLRMDLDVPIGNSKFKTQNSKVVMEDYRLKAGLPTLKLCLENAEQVVVMGHLGRPEGKYVAQLSVEPIYHWLVGQGLNSHLESGKLKILENLRFEDGEEKADLGYAEKLASFGDFFVNEAFAAHHPAASTTVLPTLLPHALGLRFAQEIEQLNKVRFCPTHPLVAIIGGVKIEDKLPALLALAKVADYCLVGGKMATELKNQPENIKDNIFLGKLTEDGLDISQETIKGWSKIISSAKMIVWNGPLGQIQNSNVKSQKLEEMGSERGTYQIAQAIIDSKAESIIGGGDTIAAISNWNLLDKYAFVSTGGGAMLKFLAEGTLPTMEVLK